MENSLNMWYNKNKLENVGGDFFMKKRAKIFFLISAIVSMVIAVKACSNFYEKNLRRKYIDVR